MNTVRQSFSFPNYPASTCTRKIYALGDQVMQSIVARQKVPQIKNIIKNNRVRSLFSSVHKLSCLFPLTSPNKIGKVVQ